ncbi:MAG: type I-U CRISPR-associated protein Csx17, partial [Chloroflexota bacterium]
MDSLHQKRDLVLSGCAAEPLMMYLKALGVLRLVAEQKEPDVRACWRNDLLVLHTALDRDTLLDFFLLEYTPTPIVAPWNSRYKTGLKSDPASMAAIEGSSEQRLSKYREVISLTRDIGEEDKSLVLAECRNRLPDYVVPWLDAVYVLTGGKPDYPPLMSAGGTVGTSGSGDLSMNHMKNLVLALGLSSGKRGQDDTMPRQWLRSALLREGSPRLTGGTPGQFNPGGIGGPNATVGFEADSLTNPWDFVLMIEGALLFAGAVARRLAPESRTRATFPFTVAPTAAGYGTQADIEYRTKGSRGEVWLPLWEQPATYREVAHVFAEGRAQVGMRRAETGSDFARAIASLGVERGVSEFMRFGFLQRSGKDGIIATSLGRYRVSDNSAVDVLLDTDGWLRRLHSAARRENAPEGLQRCLRQVDKAVMDLAQAHHRQGRTATSRGLQQVLIALGRAESWLSRSALRSSIPPLAELRGEWYQQADDGSPEFRVAAAIASIHGSPDGVIPPIRSNLESVERAKGSWQWIEANPSAVWRGVDLLDDMAAVVMRRCLDARMAAADSVPLSGVVSASLHDILSFLGGRLDERGIAELVLPLSMVRWRDVSDNRREISKPERSGDLLLPISYAVLKMLFLPYRLKQRPQAEEVRINPEPS